MGGVKCIFVHGSEPHTKEYITLQTNILHLLRKGSEGITA